LSWPNQPVFATLAAIEENTTLKESTMVQQNLTHQGHGIREQVEALHLLKHPFYQAWMAGTLSRSTLQDYATQYYAHVRAFPRYVSAAHSQCESDEARKLLLENLNDEEGVTHGTAHPELWLRFAEGLGCERKEIEARQPRAAIQNVITSFLSLTRSSYPEALGAIYAYECQVPEVASSKIEGLIANYGIRDERTLSFFKVHEQADVYHRQTLETLIAELNNEDQSRAQAAAKKAAQALWDFLSDVQAEGERAAS
jgi:pyrroloquinoline-quinone synthase